MVVAWALFLSPGAFATSTTAVSRTATLSVTVATESEPEPFPEDAFFYGESVDVGFIEAIEVAGNTKTARILILSRLLVDVGDLVDDAKLEESRLRLLATGFFKSVEFSLKRGSRRGRLLLLVEVAERNTILIDELYLGTSELSRLYGGFGVAENNFLGRGVTVGGAFVAGEGRHAVELRSFVPELATTPLQMSVSAIWLRGQELIDDGERQNELIAPPTESTLAYRRFGGTLGLGLGAGPAQRVSLAYRLEAVRAERLPNFDPVILRRAPQIQFDDSVLASLTASYERDTRDDAFVPSQGHRISAAVEVGTSLVGSSYEFSKYTLELQQAVSLFGDHALVLRFFGGMVQGQTPFFNQFFLGDYAYFVPGRRFLPRAAQVNFSSTNDYDDLLASAGIDYHLPLLDGGDLLYRLYFFSSVELAVSASLEEVQEDATGRGLGRGFPLSLDIGLKLDTWLGNFTVSLAYISSTVVQRL